MPGYTRTSTGFYVIQDSQRLPAYIALDGKPVAAGPMTYFDMGFLTPDLNADGLADLVISLNRGVQRDGNTGYASAFFLNDGKGSFREVSAEVTGGVTPLKELTGYATGNLDSDSALEVLLVSQGTRTSPISGDVIAYYDAGTGGIVNKSTQLPGLTATNGTGSGGSNASQSLVGRDIAIGDLDRDGDNDVFVLSFGGPDNLQPAFVLINDGNGNFTARADAALTELSRLHFGAAPGPRDNWFSTALLDANDDGAMDIVGGLVTLQGTRSNFIAINDGSGGFSQNRLLELPAPLYGTQNTSTRDIAVGDLNGDGRADLLLSQSRQSPFLAGRGLQLLFNDNGSFSEQSARITYTNPRPDGTQSYTDGKQVGLLDFNGDGHLDIVERGQNVSVNGRATINFSIFINDGLGNFKEIPRAEFSDIVYLQAPIGAGIEPMWTDINKDGITDFIVVNTTDDGTVLRLSFDVYQGTTAYISDSRVFNGTAGNNQLTGTGVGESFFGRGGNDALDGGGGIDSARYSSARSNFAIVRDGALTLVTDRQGNEGSDTLRNIERLHFSDLAVALDLDGHAGTVARVLGALLGPAGVANKQYVGIGLQLLDEGVSAESLMSSALTAVLGQAPANSAVVNLLYTNLAGVAPGASELASFTTLLDQGTMTQVSLALAASEHALNLANIGLVGLASSGLEFLQ